MQEEVKHEKKKETVMVRAVHRGWEATGVEETQGKFR